MTLAVQSLTAMALAVPAVLAPVAAGDYGVAPTAVGRWVGFSYMAAMFAGLAGGTFVGRYGPVRMLQIAVLGVAIGLTVGAGAHVALLLVCGALLGAAHGLVNPASSAILAAASPPRIRSMVFSIKQTGVPLGGAVAGILVPGLLLWMGWQAALLVLAIGASMLLALVAPYHRVYDTTRRVERLHLRTFAAPVAEVWANRPVRELGVVSGVYSAVQISFITYLVSYLKLELGYSLVAAGVVFSVACRRRAGQDRVGAVADHLLRRARCSPRWSSDGPVRRASPPSTRPGSRRGARGVRNLRRNGGGLERGVPRRSGAACARGRVAFLTGNAVLYLRRRADRAAAL
jgi:MFS family permease